MSNITNREIKLSYHDSFYPDTFILVRKQISFYKLNEKYFFRSYNGEYLGVFYLVSIKTFNFNDVDTELSFLHKNTTPEIYIQILEYHNFKKFDILSRLIFTNQKQFSDE